MMSLEKKSQNWVKHNIISMAQREQILEREQVKQHPFALFGIMWLGILLSFLGVVAFTEASWAVIPESVKLLVAGIFLVGSLTLAFFAVQKQKTKLAEIALFVAFFMIGGGIGLVAQIFNLPMQGASGLFLWLILSFGIVAVSKRKWLAFLWIPLFFGGIIGYMKIELLLLFFEQSPLFATGLIGGVLLCFIYLSHFFTDKFAVSLYHWSIILYFPVVFLGDIAMRAPIQGFFISLGFLALLLLFAISARRSVLFNVTGFFIVARILIFYFQMAYNPVHAGIVFLSAGAVVLLGVGGFILWRKRKMFKQGSQRKKGILEKNR